MICKNCLKQEDLMHKFFHGPAGSGKTTKIANFIKDCKSYDEISIIHCSKDGGREILNMFNLDDLRPQEDPPIRSWHRFLVDCIIKPYSPAIFPDHIISGIDYPTDAEKDELRTEKHHPNHDNFKDIALTPEGKIKYVYIESITLHIMSKFQSSIVNLGKMFQHIVIDDVQLMSNEGLRILDLLLNQQNGCRICLYGDFRQIGLREDTKPPGNEDISDFQFSKSWLKKQQNLKIKELDTTYRFPQNIAAFSDSIFKPDEKFTNTVSVKNSTLDHAGLFYLSAENLGKYIEKYEPYIVRYNRSSRKEFDDLKPASFFEVKGKEFERLAILASESIEKFIFDKKYLGDKSGSLLYLAVTRSKSSVAFVVNKIPKDLLSNNYIPFQTAQNTTLKIKRWSPEISYNDAPNRLF